MEHLFLKEYFSLLLNEKKNVCSNDWLLGFGGYWGLGIKHWVHWEKLTTYNQKTSTLPRNGVVYL